MLLRVPLVAAAAALAAIGTVDGHDSRSARVPQSNAPSMQKSIPDMRLVLLDTREKQQIVPSAPQVNVPPPGPSQGEKQSSPPPPQPAPKSVPAPAPKVEKVSSDSDKKDVKPEAPKPDARPQPKAAVPQSSPAPQPKASAPKPSDDDEDDDGDDGDAPHEGGPPSGNDGNRRATPTGRRDFKPVRGGDHKPIKPKRVGFQYLRNMFSTNSSASPSSLLPRVAVPLVLAFAYVI